MEAGRLDHFSEVKFRIHTDLKWTWEVNIVSVQVMHALHSMKY